MADVVSASHPVQGCAQSTGGGRIWIIEEALDYPTAWEYQTKLHRRRAEGACPDTVMLLQHAPVYTLGRRTQPAHWGGDEAALRLHGADVRWVNRGGSVTYHGPGQAVLYPIIRLADHARGPRQFVHRLEQVVLRVLHRWDIKGQRLPGKPGIWVAMDDPLKIASVGLRVEGGVTLHGVALNVENDLAPFRLIHPCGDRACRVTSMTGVTGTRVAVQDVLTELAGQFARDFPGAWSISAPMFPISACP